MVTKPASSPADDTQHVAGMGFHVWRVRDTGMMSQPHTHPDIEMNYLLSGGFSYLHGGSVCPVEAGRFTVFWGGIPHQTVAPGIRGEGIWITLPLTWFLQWRLPGELPERLFNGEIIAAPPDPADQALLTRWLDDAASRNPARRRVLLLEMEARFNRLALDAAARKAPVPPRPADTAGAGQLSRVTRFLAQHYREPLSVPAIAGAVGLHPKYLMRVFKRQCGISVWEYLTRLRIAHAQRLLVTTPLKVLDVAMESGFASVAPFYAAFATHTRGLRPLDYRRRHQLAKPS